MSNLQVIIGIEIHLELNTKTKMFSSAANDFSLAPNTAASVIDLAYPGTLPQLNKEAVSKAIKLAKALKMKIDNELHFDRKNYFYPDLPKGFQITQDRRPIAKNGEIITASKVIKIEKFHLEEDTAKSVHNNNLTFLNYNRAGTPLVEIVTEPVIFSSQEAVDYIEAIKELAIILDISDAKMEEGSMRADINISLRPYGTDTLGTKVEIKNLNSLTNVKKSIDDEIKKQTKAIFAGKQILQATKRFDETKQETVIMRVKTGAVDYKFFPETNIVPIRLEQNWIDSIQVCELPWEKRKRYESENIDKEFIEKLMSDVVKANFFDSIEGDDRKTIVKIFFAEIVQLSNSKNVSVDKLNISPSQITEVINYLNEGTISGKHVKEIFPLLSQGNMSVVEIINTHGMKQFSDLSSLEQLIDKIILLNKDFIEQNKDRAERVVKFLLGQLMKETNGQANPVLSAKILEKKLSERK